MSPLRCSGSSRIPASRAGTFDSPRGHGEKLPLWRRRPCGGDSRRVQWQRDQRSEWPISSTASRSSCKSSEACTEVDDAGAQNVAAIYHRIGDVGAAAALERRENPFVQVVERVLIGGATIDCRRHVSERRDAEIMRHRLQLGMLGGAIEELAREADVFTDRLGVALSSGLPDAQPHLQCSEAA